MNNKRLLPKRLEEEVAYFFAETPPSRISRNLRKMLTAYLKFKFNTRIMKKEEFLIDMQNLFELLDMAEDELEGEKEE